MRACLSRGAVAAGALVAASCGVPAGPATAITAEAPARPPVVMLVLDEFPSDALLGPDGRIDAVRYPTFARLARTGTWFPNAHTVYDATTKALPAILDGRLPRRDVPGTYEGHPETVFDLFGRRGYRIVSSEEATAVCPPRWCPGADPIAPKILPLLNAGRRERLERFIRSIRPGRPGFYFKHAMLPHGPHLYLPSGKQGRRGPEPLPGIETVPGFHNRTITDYNRQRTLLQIGFVDRAVGRLLRRLRDQGMLNRTLIVITADHGISTEVGVGNRRVVSRSNIDEVAPVPLFIKAPGQKGGQTVSTYVRTTDIVPTIAHILGWALPYRAEGRSAFPVVHRRQSMDMLKRDFSGWIRIPAKTMERRRRALVEKRLALFGSGDWASLYTGVGPNRHLLGRLVAELEQKRIGGLQAIVAGAQAMRSVRAQSSVLPTQIAGRVRGGTPGAVRDIAVAVNGRIEAVSRTFYLRGDSRESFAVNVPEASIRTGRNYVQVFEVVVGPGRQLRLIGGA